VRLDLHCEPDGPRISCPAEELSRHDRAVPRHRGWLGRLERRLARGAERWQQSDGVWTRRLRTVWRRLQHYTYADEPALVRLRTAERLEIAHAASLPSAEAAVQWEALVAARRRRHRAWFAFNLAISPLTVLLAPLPGPNLVGYWFAYRAVRHGLILSGLRKLSRGKVAVSFRPATVPAVPAR
jgi:hypothetical protein